MLAMLQAYGVVGLQKAGMLAKTGVEDDVHHSIH